MFTRVTIAIPTLNAGPGFSRTLAAIAGQRVPIPVDLLVCDSGSTDGTPALARAAGARVIEIPRSEFSHGRTRNRLINEAATEAVALLTQDAEPADPTWLAALLAGLESAPDVGLAFGPYLPRPGASPMVARELTEWFEGQSDDRRPRIERLTDEERKLPDRAFMGRRGFFTDANGVIRRAAWEQVPFRDVAYAEDHRLAIDMLRAGWGKAFVPTAAVLHSHDYSTWGWLRRSFDEARAVHEIYDFAEPRALRWSVNQVRGRVRADVRWVASRSGGRGVTPVMVARSLVHHTARVTGTMLGTRAAALPSGVVRRLSLERRSR